MDRRSSWGTKLGKGLMWAGIAVGVAATLAAVGAAVFFSGGAAAAPLAVLAVVAKGAGFAFFCGAGAWGVTKLYQKFFKGGGGGPPSSGASPGYRRYEYDNRGYRKQSRWRFWKRRDHQQDRSDTRSISSENSFEDEKRSKLRKPTKALPHTDYEVSRIDKKYAYFIKADVESSREYRFPLKKLNTDKNRLLDLQEEGTTIHLRPDRESDRFNINEGPARSRSRSSSRRSNGHGH